MSSVDYNALCFSSEYHRQQQRPDSVVVVIVVIGLALSSKFNVEGTE